MRRTDGPFPVWEILPGKLYQRAKTHNLDFETKVQGFEHYGIDIGVSMAPPTGDPHLALILMEHIHLPIPDSRIRDVLGLESLAMELASAIEQGPLTVVTMCNAGRNRSGLLSALIVRELTGLPGWAAMDLVRKERPEALANPYFEEYLASLP